MIDRCEEYMRQPPPPEWDGVEHLKSKSRLAMRVTRAVGIEVSRASEAAGCSEGEHLGRSASAEGGEGGTGDGEWHGERRRDRAPPRVLEVRSCSQSASKADEESIPEEAPAKSWLGAVDEAHSISEGVV